MHSFLLDLRYTARELRKRPTFALTAILSLALGIAATSAVFSVVYAVLLDPFPYPGSNRLMEPRLLDPAGNEGYAGMNGDQLERLRQAKSVESIAGMDGISQPRTAISRKTLMPPIFPPTIPATGARRLSWADG